jgi:hypothetical protein
VLRAARHGPLSGRTEPIDDDTGAMPALKFEIQARWGKARAARMTLPHYTASTPMFMPVGTQGTVKGLTSRQLEELDCHVILGNTYHLGARACGGCDNMMMMMIMMMVVAAAVAAGWSMAVYSSLGSGAGRGEGG